MFKQEIVNEYASRIYGDMRDECSIPYHSALLLWAVCLYLPEEVVGTFRFEETGIGGKFTTVSHISIVPPVNCCFQMIVFGIGFHREVKHCTTFISIPPRSEHLNRSEGFSQNKTPES